MIRPSLSSLIALSLTSIPVLASDAQQTGVKPEQLVIVSFDGAHDNALWERSRAIAKRTGASFTYFLSCTFVMTKENRKGYQAPHEKRGKSNVGFAPDGAVVTLTNKQGNRPSGAYTVKNLGITSVIFRAQRTWGAN